MPVSAKTLRTQLALLRPLLSTLSLSSLRKGQEKVGELIAAKYRGPVLCREHPFARFSGSWCLPQEVRRQGVILYLHGGGYCCGGMKYASGVGAMLASLTGARVFSPAYRLAPEHPFPAALEDALESYRYLLQKGYDRILLCGESAGGGLCYSLCMELNRLQLPMPVGILAISPWTDLTGSGESYEKNREADPSMRWETLDYYAKNYTTCRKDPLVSPLYGDLSQMPPSMIFVGGDEIMLSDAQLLHQALLDQGAESTLTVRPHRWHGYILYGLKEDQQDLTAIGKFLNRHLCQENKLRWLRLDNAAKIYPAARRRNWSNIFRLSATLTEPVDKIVLQSALDVTVRRFPSIAARLRKGVFWYYLQQLDHAPEICPENSYPLTRMSAQEMRKCAFRVIAYENRIAVELFHSLTDGNGALIFLKSLVAEYLLQKHGVRCPAEHGVLGRLEEPSAAELEDSFQKYGGNIAASRKATDAWRLLGTPEKDGFLNLTCFKLPTKAVLEKSHEYGVSATTFLCACLMMALQQLQCESVPNPARRKSIKVLIRHRMGLDITPKHMSTMIATNTGAERLLAVRVIPLFLKNMVMKAVFDSVGERKSCMSMSNLGQVQVPEALKPYISHFDFILGVQATAPYNCGILSYGDELRINLIRNITEPVLEERLHRVLKDMGIPVCVESNRAERS